MTVPSFGMFLCIALLLSADPAVDPYMRPTLLLSSERWNAPVAHPQAEH
jgi:hypothetical protein